MIHARLRMRVAPEKQEETLRVLHSLAERTRVKPGCMGCSICLDIEDPPQVILEELWRSEEEMDRHLRSEEYRTILLVMEMAEEAPEIRFDTVASSQGVEAIEKARSKAEDGE